MEHKVISGDTLSKIVKKYYGRLDEQILKQVMESNHITNPNKISVGQVLQLSVELVDGPQSTKSTVTPSNITKVSDINNDVIVKELPKENYLHEEFKKDMIVLHLTAGYNWEGAYNTFLNQTDPKKRGVATPFIVDLKGPKYIIKLFDEKYWGYHLGQNEYCNNWNNDKRSIAIEIVNVGPAWFEKGVWRDCWHKTVPEQNIIKGENRNAQGGVKFPDDQVIAVCNLVNYLCDKWNIPKQVPKDKMTFQLPKLNTFKGISAHMMFRRQGKYDMGPAWPWQKIIEICKLNEVNLV